MIDVAAIVCGLGIAVGIAGTALPLLPGIPLVWTSIVGYGLLTEFGPIGWAVMIVVTLATVWVMIAGVRIPQRRAASEGMTVRDQLAGLLFGIAGFFLIPVVGLPIGFVVGVFVMRWRSTGDAETAWRSSLRTVGAILMASAIQFAVAIGMALIWLAWVFIG